MVVRCSRCMAFKNHTKVPAKNVKEDVADREDVVSKASLKKQKS